MQLLSVPDMKTVYPKRLPKMFSHVTEERQPGCLNGAECPDELRDFLSNQMQDYMATLRDL